MSRVIQIHNHKTSFPPYHRMPMLELLEHMMRFQEERSRSGGLTRPMIMRGIKLFIYLRDRAETEELRMLAGSYLKNLKAERETI